LRKVLLDKAVNKNVKKSRTYFQKNKDKEFVISSMKKYYKKKQEMDKFLEKIITPYIKKKSLTVTDVCCGLGHIVHLLERISPNSQFLGIDETRYLIEEAKKLNQNKKNINFELSNAYDIKSKYKKAFDISINWKTLSWLPYYDKMIESLFRITKNHIFLSSLFYDGYIDFEIKVREYKKEHGKNDFNGYYNVYSYPRFEEFVYSLGAKNIEAYDFQIGIDLPRPPPDQMGTYTYRLENKQRLQVSGVVLMPWKIIRIDL